MTEKMNKALYSFLDHYQIAYQSFSHPPVFTCEEADQMLPDMPGRKTKNLFLCDHKKNHHFLVSVAAQQAVDLKWLGAELGVKGLRFAPSARLLHHLKLTPGSVTLLAAFNDAERRVSVVIDRYLWEAPAVQCHPLVNTETLVLPRAGLVRFFELTGHHPRIIDFA